MAFQPGNKDQRKPKLLFDALMAEFKAVEAVDPQAPRTMRSIARKLIAMADEGDIQAIKEVFNRIDGMPVQIVENINENINYVALMPPRAKTIDAWLTNFDPETKQLSKQ
jgi:hypothetical protein